MGRRQHITPRNLAKRAARVAHELKATDIVILDVRKLCDITDFFLICTADNRRHLRAIHRRLTEEVKALGTLPPRSEGQEGSAWILLDCYDIVVHLFDPDARRFYDLELLWGDAPRVTWKSKSPRR